MKESKSRKGKRLRKFKLYIIGKSIDITPLTSQTLLLYGERGVNYKWTLPTTTDTKRKVTR